MTLVTETATELAVTEMNTENARLTRRSNAKVNKDLSFTTKRDAAKMA